MLYSPANANGSTRGPHFLSGSRGIETRHFFFHTSNPVPVFTFVGS
jgi:hypothetical protein